MGREREGGRERERERTERNRKRERERKKGGERERERTQDIRHRLLNFEARDEVELQRPHFTFRVLFMVVRI